MSANIPRRMSAWVVISTIESPNNSLRAVVSAVSLVSSSPDRPRLKKERDRLWRWGKGSSVLWISLAIVGLALLQAAGSYLQIFCTSRIGYEIAYGLRGELFTHLQSLSLSFFNRGRSGELLTKLTADTTALSELFGDSMVEITTHPLILLGMFALMFALNWQLGLIVLATLAAV